MTVNGIIVSPAIRTIMKIYFKLGFLLSYLRILAYKIIIFHKILILLWNVFIIKSFLQYVNMNATTNCDIYFEEL